jgi:pyridoxine 4-dehydrogenase
MADTTLAARAKTIKIGDKIVNRLGLGTNRIHDDKAGQGLLMQAVNMGVNFIDTAHVYTGGESEVAIGNALAPYIDGLVLATKGGMGNGASPNTLRAELLQSLSRIRTDRIDLYQLHRVDPTVPLVESVGALKQFQDQGLIEHIGLSEVSIEQLEEAMSMTTIVSVQNEYSLVNRQHEDVVDFCAANNIVFIPWSPLGGRHGDSAKVEKLVAEMAKKYEATAQQIALAWLLNRSPMILPIPGTTSIAHLKDNLKAANLKLSDADYQLLTTSA